MGIFIILILGVYTMGTIKESKAFKKQRNINFFIGAVAQIEKALNNARNAVKSLTKDLSILKEMLKDERKR